MVAMNIESNSRESGMPGFLVDPFIPVQTSDNPRFLRLCAAVIQSLIAISLVGAVLTILYVLLGSDISQAEIVVLSGGTIAPILGCLFIRLTGNVDGAVVLTNAAGVVFVSIFAYETAGIYSPGIPLLFGFLVMAAGYGRGKVTVITLLMNSFAILILFTLGEYNLLPADRISEEDRNIFTLLGLLVLISFTSISLYFQSRAWRTHRI